MADPLNVQYCTSLMIGWHHHHIGQFISICQCIGGDQITHAFKNKK